MDHTIYRILEVFSFCLGAVVASFLNVVIYRVPEGMSIVKPASHCPKCNTPIKWYHNIPILAWLYLRGKCAYCKAPFSPRYALVELLGGIVFLMSFKEVGLTFMLPFVWIWLSLMIVGTFIDFDHKLLPDFVTVGGMILGVAMNGLATSLTGDAYWILNSLIGLGLGFGLFWLIRFIGGKVFGREAMGLGDVFLMGAVGAMTGWVGVLATMMLSSISGSIIGIALVGLKRAKIGKMIEIPFGPYICLGCFIYMFWGNSIVNWYLRLLGV